MIVTRESAARRLVTPVDAMNAMESAFKHVAQRDATNFQVVWERLLPGSDGCRNKEAWPGKGVLLVGDQIARV